MNANEIASEVAAQVAHKQVKAHGNQVHISLTRDPFDGAAFRAYQELIAQVHDSLKVHAKDWTWSRGGGAEMRTRRGTVEIYNTSVEVSK